MTINSYKKENKNIPNIWFTFRYRRVILLSACRVTSDYIAVDTARAIGTFLSVLVDS